MRTDNINITMKMPLPVNNPDRNGVMYSKEAFKKAFEDVNGRPLEVLLNDGNRTPIGVIQDITYVEDEFGDYALVNGRIMYGGTCEYIQDLEKVSGVITSMTLASVGIGD